MAKNNKEYNDALYQKTYRRNHPDKTLQYRINSNINFTINSIYRSSAIKLRNSHGSNLKRTQAAAHNSLQLCHKISTSNNSILSLMRARSMSASPCYF